MSLKDLIFVTLMSLLLFAGIVLTVSVSVKMEENKRIISETILKGIY